MSVNILILTHDNVGTALLKAATRTLGHLPLPVKAIPISYDCDPDLVIPDIQQLINQFGRDNDGVLILTDLFGSTPCNIAQYFNNGTSTQVVSGINLPMLLRVLNYPTLNLASLAEKAATGGRDGVLNCCEAYKGYHYEN